MRESTRTCPSGGSLPVRGVAAKDPVRHGVQAVVPACPLFQEPGLAADLLADDGLPDPLLGGLGRLDLAPQDLGHQAVALVGEGAQGGEVLLAADDDGDLARAEGAEEGAGHLDGGVVHDQDAEVLDGDGVAPVLVLDQELAPLDAEPGRLLDRDAAPHSFPPSR